MEDKMFEMFCNDVLDEFVKLHHTKNTVEHILKLIKNKLEGTKTI